MHNDNIIKLLDLKDSDIEVDGPVDRNGVRILTLRKKSTPRFCPICGFRMHSRGIYTRTVNHPIMQDGRQLVLKLKQRRWRCTNQLCNHSCNDSFSFVEPFRRNTVISDFLIVTAFKDSNLSAAQIAKQFSVSDTYAITTFARYVDMPRRDLTEVICIDEVHVNVSKLCHYALVIQDFITGEPIDMIANRRQEVTEPYFASIPIAQRSRVKYLVTDMYRPYLAYVDKYFPNAVSVIDSFHVVKLINAHLLRYLRGLQRKYKARDEQRHDELEQQMGRRIDFTPSKEYYLLKHYHWLILKNNADIRYSAHSSFNKKLRCYITIGEIESMLFDIDPTLRELRNLKERYITFNRIHGGKYKQAKKALNELIELYRNCPYRAFHEIAETLTFHFDGIANSFIMIERYCQGDTHVSRLSNGPMESLNRIAKDLKRHGRGYQNFEHLRNRFLFSQRANAQILGTPKTLEDAVPKTNIKRGPYTKRSRI